MTAKVIRLTRSNFHDLIDDVVKAYDNNTLNDFICITSIADLETTEVDEFHSRIGWHWFNGKGGSTVSSLGLLEIMKHKIMEFYNELNEGPE